MVKDKFYKVWLGQYQWPVDQGATAGWSKCSSGVDANETLGHHVWQDPEDELWGSPGDHEGMEDCAVRYITSCDETASGGVVAWRDGGASCPMSCGEAVGVVASEVAFVRCGVSEATGE